MLINYTFYTFIMLLCWILKGFWWLFFLKVKAFAIHSLSIGTFMFISNGKDLTIMFKMLHYIYKMPSVSMTKELQLRLNFNVLLSIFIFRILLFKTIVILYVIDIDIFAHKNHLMLWKSINSEMNIFKF